LISTSVNLECSRRPCATQRADRPGNCPPRSVPEWDSIRTRCPVFRGHLRRASSYAVPLT